MRHVVVLGVVAWLAVTPPATAQTGTETTEQPVTSTTVANVPPPRPTTAPRLAPGSRGLFPSTGGVQAALAVGLLVVGLIGRMLRRAARG